MGNYSPEKADSKPRVCVTIDVLPRAHRWLRSAKHLKTRQFPLCKSAAYCRRIASSTAERARMLIPGPRFDAHAYLTMFAALKLEIKALPIIAPHQFCRYSL